MRKVETCNSIEAFLNRSVLFIQGIDRECPKSEILAVREEPRGKGLPRGAAASLRASRMRNLWHACVHVGAA